MALEWQDYVVIGLGLLAILGAIYGMYKAFNEKIEGTLAPLTSAFSKAVAVTSIVSVPLQIINHALRGAYNE